ncbi:unnamed protein product [Prunus armeniaca]
MAPMPILEISLGLARDNWTRWSQTIWRPRLAANKLEKQIEELQKQLAGLRERQNRLGDGLGTKAKATFLVQNMVSASRPTLEIAEASIH